MPNRISRLWNSLSGRDEYAERIAEEMAFHIEEKTRENIAAGMSETEARREAGAAFGHTGRLREETRDAGIFMLVDGVLGDLKLAVRGLRRKPVVAVTIILSLGLGIGANAAIFSLVDGILRKPHQITSPDRVMAIEESRRGERSNGSPTRIADFAQQVSRFESVSGLYDEGLILTGRGNPERWQVLRTVGDTLKVLQVTPVIGRSFTADEMAGSERVLLLDYGFWQRRFSGNPSVMGQSFTLGGEVYSVIGILPRNLDYPGEIDAISPATKATQNANRNAGFLYTIARLKPTVTRSTAQAELTGVMERLEKQYPATDKNRNANLVPLVEKCD